MKWQPGTAGFSTVPTLVVAIERRQLGDKLAGAVDCLIGWVKIAVDIELTGKVQLGSKNWQPPTNPLHLLILGYSTEVDKQTNNKLNALVNKLPPSPIFFHTQPIVAISLHLRHRALLNLFSLFLFHLASLPTPHVNVAAVSSFLTSRCH